MKAVVFDLDGTLVDSAPDIHAAANRMLESEDKPPLDLETIITFIGDGLPRLVERVMCARGVHLGRHAEMTERMLEIYNAASTELTRPYPNLMATLDRLQSEGFALGVCTNKPEASARDILRDLGMEAYFDVVIGGDSLPVKKPDPAPLEKAFGDLGATARLYVGDSEVDAATAEAVAVDFALFTEGYRKAPIEALTHRARFADFADLPAIAQAAFGDVVA